MKKALTFVLVLFVMFSLTSYSQTVLNYKFVKAFPDTNLKIPSGVNNTIAVDRAGKVWIASYSGALDSLPTAGLPSVYKKTGWIRIYNPSGTQTAFSPMKTVTVSAVTDTFAGSGYGMTTDQNGNIIVVKPSTTLYRINYLTGAGMTKVVNPLSGYTSSVTQPSVDAAGEIFLAPVSPGTPATYLNPNFTASGTNVTDSTNAFERTIAVSANGNDVYICYFTGTSGVIHYHSAFGSIGPYAPVDSIKGLVVETIGIHPTTGYIWMGSGSLGGGIPDSLHTAYSWYAYNPATKHFVDSLKWHPTRTYDASGYDPRPRGIAFSPTGDTVYVGAFNLSDETPVQMFVRGSLLGVQQVSPNVPTGFELQQNYPNPFNPSTEIKFSLAKSGYTTLRVFDVLGRQIAELVAKDLTQGTYKATFEAGKFSTGTYIYELRSGDTRLVKKMMLLK